MRDVDSVPVNDSLLLLQVQQGNKKAFNALYEKYWDKVYANAYKRLKDEDQAKDIAQEIFVSIWLNKENPIDNLPAYLNIAVRNRVFKLVEKQKSVSPFFDKLAELPALHQDADAALAYKEFYKAYEDLLGTLPPKRQMIFRLRYQEDQTTKAIADQLGITRKTVQNQLIKAIEHLKMILLPIIMIIFSMLHSHH